MTDTPPDLGVWAAQLSGEVRGLREDVRSFGRRLGRAEGRLGWLAVAVVVAVALACGVAVALLRIDATDHRVDAFCPLLALVVGGADPSTRPAGPARDAYVSGMAVMAHTYEDLGCATIAPLVPGRTGGR